jgi:hypothetical protein
MILTFTRVITRQHLISPHEETGDIVESIIVHPLKRTEQT